MSFIKPNPNHKLSEEHIKILKIELGVVRSEEKDDNKKEN